MKPFNQVRAAKVLPTDAELMKLAEEEIDRREIEKRKRLVDNIYQDLRSNRDMPARIEAEALALALGRGYTFLKDIWPDHPAADRKAHRGWPLGVGKPFELRSDGVYIAPSATGVATRICAPAFWAHRGGGGQQPLLGVKLPETGAWRSVPVHPGSLRADLLGEIVGLEVVAGSFDRGNSDDRRQAPISAAVAQYLAQTLDEASWPIPAAHKAV